MRTLYLDIETTPIEAWAWGLWDQNIGLSQIKVPTKLLCFAARFAGERRMRFHSAWADGQAEMVAEAHRLLSEADVVVHYNGRKFDVRHLNREFKEQGLLPPAPFQQLDLLQTVRKAFYLPSFKLEYVASWLGLDGKVSHEGFGLWKSCLAGDELAQRRMQKYNKRDVELLLEVHAELLPWIAGHPHVGLIDGNPGACRRCGGSHFQRRGFAYTRQGRFQQYQCQGCGGWERGSRRIDCASRTEVAA